MKLLFTTLSVAILSIGFALQPAPGMNSAPQDASTTSTSCKSTVTMLVTGNPACTVSYTVALIPVPENDPCYGIGKVKISGIIKCPGSEGCKFSETQCSDQKAPVGFSCESMKFELQDPGIDGSGTWGEQAKGDTKCSDTAAVQVS